MAHLVDGTAKSIPKLFQLNMTMMDTSSDKPRFLRSLTPIERLSGLMELRTISMESKRPQSFLRQKPKRKADKIQAQDITSSA